MPVSLRIGRGRKWCPSTQNRSPTLSSEHSRRQPSGRVAGPPPSRTRRASTGRRSLPERWRLSISGLRVLRSGTLTRPPRLTLRRDPITGATTRAHRLRALTATPRRQALLALLLYVGFTLFLTWPLVTHLGSTIYLSPSRPKGDYTSVIANIRELVHGWHNPFLPGRIHDFNAPYGLPITWVNNVATFASTSILYVLTAIFGATAAVGLFVMLGFVASAMAMFLLVRRFTGSPGIALVIGYAYGFYPYVVANGEHPHHIHGGVLALMAWRMVELYERPNLRNGLLAGAACLVTLGWTPYFILLGGVLYGT